MPASVAVHCVNGNWADGNWADGCAVQSFLSRRPRGRQSSRALVEVSVGICFRSTLNLMCPTSRSLGTGPGGTASIRQNCYFLRTRFTLAIRKSSPQVKLSPLPVDAALMEGYVPLGEGYWRQVRCCNQHKRLQSGLVKRAFDGC